ncbi:hypothetical protein Syun_006811 [Stephania yunnanensis]|uniref:Methyltransferase-like protein n=1 Tax=Stephania yunnanensis TaxID=152371 RepID=A0AAP0KZX1_9MAGN
MVHKGNGIKKKDKGKAKVVKAAAAPVAKPVEQVKPQPGNGARVAALAVGSYDFDVQNLQDRIYQSTSVHHKLLPLVPCPSEHWLVLRDWSILDIQLAFMLKNNSQLWHFFHYPFGSQYTFLKVDRSLRRWQRRTPSTSLLTEETYKTCSKSKLLRVGIFNVKSWLNCLSSNITCIKYPVDPSMYILQLRNKLERDKVSHALSFHHFIFRKSTKDIPWWMCADPSLLNRFHTFLCDFSKTGFPDWFARDLGGVDFVTLVFTLSAIPFQTMPKAIGECFGVLRPGGVVLFRDYGLFDMTMLRFHPSKRVGFREYVRMDGTRTYFFCLDTVRKLFGDVGFVAVELDYCCVKSTNRRRGKSMRRVWVHGKFQKPL